MESKVIYEIRFSKPVMTVAAIAAIGLLAIGAKSFRYWLHLVACNQPSCIGSAT